MRALAITGMETAPMIPSIMSGSLIRATPPWARMSAGTRSRAITATAPASSAIFACSGVTTSMITPPLSISAMPRFTGVVPVTGASPPVAAVVSPRGACTSVTADLLVSGPGGARATSKGTPPDYGHPRLPAQSDQPRRRDGSVAEERGGWLVVEVDGAQLGRPAGQAQPPNPAPGPQHPGGDHHVVVEPARERDLAAVRG